MKLFNLGVAKSGTSTLHKAMGEAGLKSVHWKDRRHWSERKQTFLRPPRYKFTGWSIYYHYLRGDDPLEGLKGFEVVAQADVLRADYSLWPQMDQAVLKKIRHHHPECLFLLMTRDPAKVANSMIRWKTFQARLNNLGAPGILPQEATSEVKIADWVANHYAQTRAAFSNDAKFVELELTDPETPAALAEILSCKLPWWGIANRNTVNMAEEP